MVVMGAVGISQHSVWAHSGEIQELIAEIDHSRNSAWEEKGKKHEMQIICANACLKSFAQSNPKTRRLRNY